jgi:hypothetical protein
MISNTAMIARMARIIAVSITGPLRHIFLALTI